MKRSLLFTLLASVGIVACSQPKSKSPLKETASNNTLLWRISGNGLAKPSYLFGTMHMICASDIVVSDSLKKAIKGSDNVFLELNMDNLMGEMMKLVINPGVLMMRDDTTLSDLLSPEDYKKLKTHFEGSAGGMLPFSMLEKMKPMFLQALMMEGGGPKCENMIVMEQLVMDEAKKNDKKIDGLETMAFQLSIFDKIPYKVQAQQLVKLTESPATGGDSEMAILTDAYRQQQLEKLNEMLKTDESVRQFADLLLYNRNADWAQKIQELMKDKSLVIAVGAGHLPGEKGVISLLRKAGYKVEPVKNEMIKKGKEI